MKITNVAIWSIASAVLWAACIGCSEQKAAPPVAVVDEPVADPVKVQPVSEPAPRQKSDPQEKEKPSTLDKAMELWKKADDSGEGVKKWLGDRIQDAAIPNDEEIADPFEWANDMFQKLKDEGLTTADSAQEWLVEDFNSIGAWEYKVLSVPMATEADVSKVETSLNKLGLERWECFSVVAPSQPGGNHVYHLKRQKKSLMRSLPLRDMMRLVPLMGGGDGQ